MIKNDILATCLRDNTQARILMADGVYHHLVPDNGQHLFNSQAEFLRRAQWEDDLLA
jgi:hypothetical protein